MQPKAERESVNATRQAKAYRTFDLCGLPGPRAIYKSNLSQIKGQFPPSLFVVILNTRSELNRTILRRRSTDYADLLKARSVSRVRDRIILGTPALAIEQEVDFFSKAKKGGRGRLL